MWETRPSVQPSTPDYKEPEPPAPPAPAAPEFVDLTVPSDAVLGLQIERTVSSELARVEDKVEARVTRDVRVSDRIAIPAGSTVRGSVTEVDRGGRMKGKAWTGSKVSFGDYGLKALEPGWVTAREIEAGRIAITRFIKRSGRIWIRVFPDKPITKKPQETRMGKGKGAPDQWVMVVKPGRILYEMEGVPEKDAREALRLAAHKLSIRTRFVKRFEAEVAS